MGKSTSWDRAEMDQIDQFDLYFLKRAENQIELNFMVVWFSRYVKLPEGKQTHATVLKPRVGNENHS